MRLHYHMATAYNSEYAKDVAIWADKHIDEHHWIIQSCPFIGMKHILPTFMYIIPMYLIWLRLQKTSPNEISPIF